MSVSGFTQKSTSSVSSTSPATSSSHQPPTKALKAFEDADSDHTSSKPLVESTDDELTENVVQAVPNVPQEEEDVPGGEEEHEADAFVPNPDRQATLEVPTVDSHPVQVKPEVFEIGEDDHEEKQEDKGRLEEAVAETYSPESQPLLAKADQPLVQTFSVGSAAVRASSFPSRSLSDPEGFCTLFKTKNPKNQ